MFSGPYPRQNGKTHKAARARLARRLRLAGTLPCAYAALGRRNPRCAKIIVWGVTPWDLPHDDDNPGRYLGDDLGPLPACRPCNRGKHRLHGRKGSRDNPRDPAPGRETRRRQIIADRERARRARIIMPTEADGSGKGTRYRRSDRSS